MKTHKTIKHKYWQLIGILNNLADIFKDEAYNRTVFRSSDDVLRCTNGRILTKCPQDCVERHVKVN